MKLGTLLERITYAEFSGNGDTEITGLCTDSRTIKKGDIFFCYKGHKQDSHK